MSWRQVMKTDNEERLREIDKQIKALKEERRNLRGQGNTGTQSFNISQTSSYSPTTDSRLIGGNQVSIGKDSVTINGKTFPIDPSEMRDLKVVDGRVWINGKEIGGEE